PGGSTAAALTNGDGNRRRNIRSREDCMRQGTRTASASRVVRVYSPAATTSTAANQPDLDEGSVRWLRPGAGGGEDLGAGHAVLQPARPVRDRLHLLPEVFAIQRIAVDDVRYRLGEDVDVGDDSSSCHQIPITAVCPPATTPGSPATCPVPAVGPTISKMTCMPRQWPGLNLRRMLRIVRICGAESPTGPATRPGSPALCPSPARGPAPVTECVPSGKNTQNFDHQNACGKTSFGQFSGGRVGHPNDRAEIGRA